MPIQKNSTAIVKIYVPIAAKKALSEVAQSLGVSLSELLLQAASDRYLVKSGRTSVPHVLGTLQSQIKAILERLEPMPAPVPLDTSGRKVRKGAQTFFKDSTPVVPTVDAIPIYALVERLKGDRTVNARLCQVGGRDGKLFRGDLASAERVAAMTSLLDPEGLPWLPIAQDRRNWVQMSAEDFCRQILSKPSE
jgi:hypothetical protein